MACFILNIDLYDFGRDEHFPILVESASEAPCEGPYQVIKSNGISFDEEGMYD